MKILAVLLVVAVLLPAPAFSLDSDDSQIFISGFNAYQRKDYKQTIENMSSLLKRYPDTPLRDMAIFWLARGNYKAGNQLEAGKYMAQFTREYPQSPLKGTVEDELLALADKYEKGEPIGAPETLAKAPASETVERVAAERVAAERVAAERVAAERVAAERVAAERVAAERVAAERVAAESVAAERVAAERVAAERVAAERVAAERVAAERVAAERVAAERIAAERIAAGKAAEERIAAERIAAGKAAEERIAAERVAAGQAAEERKKVAAERVTRQRAAEQQIAAKADKRQEIQGKSAALRNQAIAAYKAVIDNYPGTAAASSASAKLLGLGVEYPAVKRSVAVAPQEGEISQIFNLEVAQYADVDVNLGPAPETQEVGKQFFIPIDIVNAGNGSDTFYLESGFPPEFDFHFAAASTPDIPINYTPKLAVGEKFRALAVGTVPRGNIDGQRNSYPVKIVSTFAREASQSRELALVSSAPLLRAVVKSDKARLLPGEKISYRVSLLNIGTAAARGVTLRLNYPPQYEPVGFLADRFKQETTAALVLDSLQLKSGESKDFNVSFQLKDEALADQELFLRADVINNELVKKESFVSATSVVQKISGVAARTTAEKLVVIPGQVVSIPLIVTNTGNVREVFAIKSSVPGSTNYTFFDDVNRDGKRQAGEPIINHVGPLSPKEEAYVVLEAETPLSAVDGAVASVSVSFLPENASDISASVNLQLTYSRPILELAMAANGGRLKPGEVSSLDLNCVNRGSSMAKQVTLQSILPAQLELVAADPVFFRAENGIYTWRFEELGAGEKRNIKITYRVKPGIAVGTNMQLKNLLNYQDLLGNRY